MRDHPFLAPNADFLPFGLSHGLAVAVFVAFTVAVVLVGRRLHVEGRHRLGVALAVATLGCWLAGFTGRLLLGDWRLDADLPLNLCPISAFGLVFALIGKRERLFEVLYFWVLAACAQALLTPELREAYPHYMFWRFWVLHAGLVTTVVYAVAVLGWVPRPVGILRAFGWGVAYLAAVSALNPVLGTNYAFTQRKPLNPTILDALGPHPWYLVAMALAGLACFAVVYLPVAGARVQASKP